MPTIILADCGRSRQTVPIRGRLAGIHTATGQHLKELKTVFDDVEISELEGDLG